MMTSVCMNFGHLCWNYIGELVKPPEYSGGLVIGLLYKSVGLALHILTCLQSSAKREYTCYIISRGPEPYFNNLLGMAF